jgi:hypothetical protein
MDRLEKVIELSLRGLVRTKDRMLYTKLARLHRRKGGLTWHLIRGNARKDSVVRASQYVGVVSVHPVNGETLSHSPTAQDFERFVNKNFVLLRVPSAWRCIGSWHDQKSGEHHLDISEICFSYEQAANLGRKHKQKSIYLLHEDRSVQIK